jgi:hypothetical protein
MRVVSLVAYAAAAAVALSGCTERGRETVHNTFAAEPWAANFDNLNKMHAELDNLERAIQESQIPKAKFFKSPSIEERFRAAKAAETDGSTKTAKTAKTAESTKTAKTPTDLAETESKEGILDWLWPFSPKVKPVGDVFDVRCSAFVESGDAITWQDWSATATNNCANVGKVPKKILEAYVRGRRAEIDGYCEVFFRGLDGLQSTTRYTRDVVSDSFSLTTVLMGITQAASNQLAVLAGVQAFVNNQFDSFERFMLLAPEPFRIHKFVVIKQRAFLAEQENKIENIEHYDEALNWVREYANYCTIKGVKQIVDEAIGAQEKNLTAGSAQDAVGRAAFQRNYIGNLLQASVQHREMPGLYWFFVLRTETFDDKQPVDGEPEAAKRALEANTALAKYLTAAMKEKWDQAPAASDQPQAKKDKQRYQQLLGAIKQYGAFRADAYDSNGATISDIASDMRKAYYAGLVQQTASAAPPAGQSAGGGAPPAQPSGQSGDDSPP